MTGEAELQDRFRAALAAAGWLCYHTRDSRGSEPGFPDVMAVREWGGALWALEFKSATGRLRPEQRAWQAALVASDGVRYALVTPATAAAVAREMGLPVLARELDPQNAPPCDDVAPGRAELGLPTGQYAPDLSAWGERARERVAAALRRGDR